MPRFSSLILDVDSTLCGLEGIDWIARQRDPAVARRIADLTDRAMNGELALDDVYGARLDAIRPTRLELSALGREYVLRMAPGAEAVLGALRASGVGVTLVSGGLREAILPLAHRLGIEERAVHAVRLYFDHAGEYAGFEPSPLTTQEGKPGVAAALLAEGTLSRPVLAVGDGATDAAMRGVVDAFAAFVGFVRRDHVIEAADHVIASFDELHALVL